MCEWHYKDGVGQLDYTEAYKITLWVLVRIWYDYDANTFFTRYVMLS